MAGGLIRLTQTLHALGDFHPAFKPRALLCGVAGERLDAGDVLQRPTGLVDL